MMIKSIDFFEIYIILSPYFWSCFWKILILEWFVKDHVTLKTGVMMINYTLL